MVVARPGGSDVRQPPASFPSSPLGAVDPRLPALSGHAERVSSTEQFLRELNRFGLTSVVDAGESATVYPDDYQAVAELAQEPVFPVRISNFLFAQKPGTELWQRLR